MDAAAEGVGAVAVRTFPNWQASPSHHKGRIHCSSSNLASRHPLTGQNPHSAHQDQRQSLSQPPYYASQPKHALNSPI